MHKVYMNLEKGGTGRTLTLYHLAWTLGDLFNKRVLIVDLDAQKSLAESLLCLRQTRNTIYEKMTQLMTQKIEF